MAYALHYRSPTMRTQPNPTFASIDLLDLSAVTGGCGKKKCCCPAQPIIVQQQQSAPQPVYLPAPAPSGGSSVSTDVSISGY